MTAGDKPALAGVTFLALLALACIVGPWLSPHPYDRVYRDYVLVLPSLAAHPTPAEITATVAAVAARLNVQAAAATEGRIVHIALTADAQIDPRIGRYFERGDLFGPSTITDRSDDGRSLTLLLPLRTETFPLGTDANGRDLLTRILVAGRVSLAVGCLASLVALVVGVLWGAVAGYAGGAVDMLMMRVVDVVYALPFIFFVIVLVTFFGRNVALIFVAIGCVEWLDMARIVRGQTLSLRRRDFVTAAEVLGATPGAILARHIVPNMVGPIIAYLGLLVPRVILAESFLSFLGLGVQEPATSWGILIADGARSIQGSVHLLLFPALALGATLIALTLGGEALRRRLAPRAR